MYQMNEVFSKTKMFMFHHHVETFMHFFKKGKSKMNNPIYYYFFGC